MTPGGRSMLTARLITIPLVNLFGSYAEGRATANVTWMLRAAAGGGKLAGRPSGGPLPPPPFREAPGAE